MAINIPTKKQIIEMNINIIIHSTDPYEDKSDAGKFMNCGPLKTALDNVSHESTTISVSKAAYCIANAIAFHSAFLNGNKRTARDVVIDIFSKNGYRFNGNYEELEKLIYALVANDNGDPDIDENTFCEHITELFH